MAGRTRRYRMAAQNQATTYARVVRLKGDPNRVHETITVWTQHILPLLKKQRGFTGVTLVGNRKTGDALTVSYWETEATMKEARGQVRPQALKVFGEIGASIIEDDECEVALLERFKPPMAGAWARVTTVHGDPAHVSEAVDTFKDKIVPIAASVWDTEYDLQKSEASISSLRTEAIKKFAGRDAKTEAFEIYFTEILTPSGSVR